MNDLEFGRTLTSIANVFGKNLNSDMIGFYLESIRGFKIEDAIHVTKKIAIQSGRMPNPTEIIKALDPNHGAVVTDKQNANIVAQKIIDGVRKFGANAKMDLLEQFLGEVGFEVVKNQWVYVCNNMQTDDEKIWFAQFRDQADAIISRHKAGQGSSMPELPKNNNISKLIETLADEKSLRGDC